MGTAVAVETQLPRPNGPTPLFGFRRGRRPVPAGGLACAQTYASQERRAVDHLLRQGYDAFCPMEGRPSKTNPLFFVEVPAFPCYVFVNLASDQPWQSINSTYGVIRLLTDRNRDRPRPLFALGREVDRVVEQLRKAVTEPFPPGTVVRVLQGPFTSFVGVVEEMDARMRTRVVLCLFNRDQTVTFEDPSDLAVVEEA